MASLFSLPSEVLISSISIRLPCREQQIRSLATLLSIRGAPCKNIMLYGLEATGKTAVVQAVLEKLSLESSEDVVMNGTQEEDPAVRFAIIKNAECISGRQLLEKTTLAVAEATRYQGILGRCENLAQLLVDIGMLLEGWANQSQTNRRFVLVFDGIDSQRDAPHTLASALARLGEFIPNLTIIFTVTSPSQHFLHLHGVPHIHFPAYSKSELLQILALHNPNPPLPSGDKDTIETWARYCAIIWDTLSKNSGREILSFRSVCIRLWPKFIRPVLEGQLSPTPFSKLILANRSLLQNDNILIPSFASSDNTTAVSLSTATSTKGVTTSTQQATIHPLTTQLPTTTRFLLISSYLCSHNPPKTDITYFCKSLWVNKRRKRGGGTALTSSRPGVSKHRKISRRLLGPQPFVLERMLAVFQFLRAEAGYGVGSGKAKKGPSKGEDVAGSADLLSAISTLVALRLVNRIGAVGGDSLDGGARFKVNIGWEVVRRIGRSVGLEVEDYVAD